MTLAALLKAPPKVHEWGERGDFTSTGLPTEVFEFMNNTLSPQSTTIETGIGISTAVFALKKTKHTCVAPDINEINRLKDYCEKNNISFSNINFICKKSYEVWYDLKTNNWDFVLVDGLHGFPTPFLDWYFLSQGLNLNGYLVIDDTHISTCRILKDFLLKEEAWKIIPPFSEKTAVFQKVRDFNYNKEFISQQYVLERTKSLNKYSRYRYLIKTIKRKLKKIYS